MKRAGLASVFCFALLIGAKVHAQFNPQSIQYLQQMWEEQQKANRGTGVDPSMQVRPTETCPEGETCAEEGSRRSVGDTYNFADPYQGANGIANSGHAVSTVADTTGTFMQVLSTTGNLVDPAVEYGRDTTTEATQGYFGLSLTSEQNFKATAQNSASGAANIKAYEACKEGMEKSGASPGVSHSFCQGASVAVGSSVPGGPSAFSRFSLKDMLLKAAGPGQAPIRQATNRLQKMVLNFAGKNVAKLNSEAKKAAGGLLQSLPGGELLGELSDAWIDNFTKQAMGSIIGAINGNPNLKEGFRTRLTDIAFRDMEAIRRAEMVRATRACFGDVTIERPFDETSLTAGNSAVDVLAYVPPEVDCLKEFQKENYTAINKALHKMCTMELGNTNLVDFSTERDPVTAACDDGNIERCPEFEEAQRVLSLDTPELSRELKAIYNAEAERSPLYYASNPEFCKSFLIEADPNDPNKQTGLGSLEDLEWKRGINQRLVRKSQQMSYDLAYESANLKFTGLLDLLMQNIQDASIFLAERDKSAEALGVFSARVGNAKERNVKVNERVVKQREDREEKRAYESRDGGGLADTIKEQGNQSRPAAGFGVGG